jgi:hypothetical protein
VRFGILRGRLSGVPRNPPPTSDTQQEFLVIDPAARVRGLVVLDADMVAGSRAEGHSLMVPPASNSAASA